MQQLEAEFRGHGCREFKLGIAKNWLETYVTEKKAPKYIEWENLDSFVYPLPERPLRVGVLGDWGSGLAEAKAVLEQMVLQGHGVDLIIHLGDVYYSGTENEYSAQFMQLIDAAREASTNDGRPWFPVYTIPGNHDYYSGGGAFYDSIERLNVGQGGLAPAGGELLLPAEL